MWPTQSYYCLLLGYVVYRRAVATYRICFFIYYVSVMRLVVLVTNVVCIDFEHLCFPKKSCDYFERKKYLVGWIHTIEKKDTVRKLPGDIFETSTFQISSVWSHSESSFFAFPRLRLKKLCCIYFVVHLISFPIPCCMPLNDFSFQIILLCRKIIVIKSVVEVGFRAEYKIQT